MTIRRYGIAALAGLMTAGGIWLPAPLPAVAAESYFCIELVLSRNWPAARFYCDATAARDNTGTILAEGIAYFFSADNAADVSHAARLWRDIPPLSDNSEWRNVSGVFDQEIDTIARNAATFDRLAQYQLGVLHETGHLSAPDPAAAVFRYQQAANAGVPEAHIALARLYQQGIGVEADPVAAEQHVLAAIEARPARVRSAPEVVPEQEDAEEALIAEAAPEVDDDASADGVATEVAAVTETAVTETAVTETTDTETTDTETTAEVIDGTDPSAPTAAPLEETFVVGRSASKPELDGVTPDVVTPDVVVPDVAVPEVAVQMEDDLAAADLDDDQVVMVEVTTSEGVTEFGEIRKSNGEAAPPELVRIITVTPQPTVSLREVPGSTPVPAAQLDVQPDVQPDAQTDAQPDPSDFVDPLVETLPVEVDDELVPATPVEPVPENQSDIAVVSRSIPTRVDRSVPADVIETDVADVVAPSTDVSVETVLPEGEPEGGDSSPAKWSPPADVAALYYPEDSLEESSSTPEQGSNDVAGQGVDATEDDILSVATGRLDTREPVDQSNLSCADPDAGATMAMPVIREDGDQSDTQSSDGLTVGTPLSEYELAAIERGIRAKAEGNIDGALEAWEPLAGAGVPTAQYLVGLLYLTGDAVPRNLRLAYAWFSLAANNGHQLANCERYRLSQRLSEDDIALADDLAGELVYGP